MELIILLKTLKIYHSQKTVNKYMHVYIIQQNFPTYLHAYLTSLIIFKNIWNEKLLMQTRKFVQKIKTYSLGFRFIT